MDVFDKLCCELKVQGNDIRAVAKELKFGSLEYTIHIEIHDSKIVQAVITQQRQSIKIR
jgi:hypothetical protein